MTPATVVAGIVNFTRWPRALSPIHVCVLGDDAAAIDLLSAGSLGLPQGSVAIGRAPAPERMAASCEVLYVGQTPGGGEQALLALLGQRPILTIGQGAAFCTDGGMFCLDGATAPVRFGVNLDAIARSGLRVNPQVLWLARRVHGALP